MNRAKYLGIHLATLAMLWWPAVCFADHSESFFKDGFEPFESVCGDGLTNGFEVCDDHNNLTCGTCRDNCTVAVTPARATGQIVVRDVLPVDEDTFTLNDGIILPVTFEFDTNGASNPQHVEIAIPFILSPGQVASTIVGRINDSELLIDAHTGAPGTVELLHEVYSTVGNHPITYISSGLTVSGMAGGAAGNCPATTGCATNADCASLLCVNHQCN